MIHSFPEFELDEERFELRRDGQPVRVEPRVLEVLVHLIRNGGRVVTKEELLDTVWKKTFVSDSALTRCIMEARRAIGDHERDVPLIKTVHGRGYRFEAVPVAAVIAIPDAVPITDPLASEPVVEPAVVRRSWGHALIALVLAVSVTAGTWFLMRRAAQAEPGRMVTIRVALLPIALADDDRELQMVGMSIADLLEQRLSKVASVRVRGADYSRPISVTAPNLVELAKRAGVEYVISGSVRATDRRERARLTLVMHQIRAEGSVRDTPLGSFDLPLLRRSEDIRQYAVLRDRVVSRVVATLRPAFELGPGGAFTPRDFESYRLYLLARERLAAGGCDGEAAVELLRRSLEIDDRFAPAWDAYAWALYRLSAACTDGSRHHRDALAAADRALALAPWMGSAVTLKAQVMAETGRVEAAYELIRTALRKDPGNVDLHRAHFAILAQTGYLDAARGHMHRVMNADPNHLAESGALATPYLYAGELQRFVDSIPGSDSPRFRYSRGFAELMMDQPGPAYRTLEPSFRSNPADAYARMSHALLAIIEERHGEARAIVRHFVRQRELVGETDAELTYRLAQLAALSGDDALAVRQLDKAVRQGFFCVDFIERDPALNAIRRTAEYSRIVTVARERRVAFGKRFGLNEAAGPRPAAS